MNDLLERLILGAEQIAGVLPGLVAAVLILLAGYFLARQIQRGLDHLLKRLDFNRAAQASGLDDVVHRTGARLDPVRAVAKLAFWFVMLVVTLLASTALGLDSINEMFGQMLSFLPALIAAIVVVILGLIVGEFVRGLILASAGNIAGVPTVARIAKGSVVLIAVFMALQHRGQSGWGWLVLAGLISIALGAMILAKWPMSGMWVIGLFVAIELIFNGWAYLFVALAARRAGKLAG